MNLSMKLIVCAVVTGTATCNAMADENAIPLKPEDFSLVAGDYRVDINPDWAYTISRIVYKDYQLIARTGFNGTVLAAASGKYIGSGHTEGGKEIVEKIVLKVDGEAIHPESGKIYSGQEIVTVKTSRIGNLRFHTEIRLDRTGILESKRFEALERQEIHLFCLYAYGFNVNTVEWLAMLSDGTFRDGVFKNDGGWQLTAQDVKWVALYDPAPGIVIIASQEPVIKPTTCRANGLWDVKDRYHKYDIFIPGPVPEGTESPLYTMAIKAFSAAPDDWRQTAIRHGTGK